jgi:hypothetical protein
LVPSSIILDCLQQLMGSDELFLDHGSGYEHGRTVL